MRLRLAGRTLQRRPRAGAVLGPRLRRRTGLSLVLVIAFGCQRTEPPSDLLLLTVDTLRADHLAIYGYERDTSPQLERWFADGAVFERAYATAAYTSASVASLLSGRLPQDHGVRLFDQLLAGRTALITEMLPAVYQSAAFVSNPVLSDEGMGIAARFDHFDDEIDLDPRVRRLERSA